MYYPTPSQMKEIESYSDKSGNTYLQLMETAGRKLSAVILKALADIPSQNKSVLMLAGSGNNGGDAFVASRLISEQGIDVTVVLADKNPATEISKYEYDKICDNKRIAITTLNNNVDVVFNKMSVTDIIVDAVFGTGFHGELPSVIKDCFEFASRCKAVKIAVDVPSGGNCTNGEISDGIMNADITVTFAAVKLGMMMYPLKDVCGKIICEDIDIPVQCFEACENIPVSAEFKDLSDIIPVRKQNSHKGTFGKLLNIAGSSEMSGAAVLSTLSALRSGAGLVKLASISEVVDRVASSVYECTFANLKENRNGAISSVNKDKMLSLIKDMSAVSIGCGISHCDDTEIITKAVISGAECPVILDADGINNIASDIDIIKDIKNKLIVTPHIGELGRLFGVSPQQASKDRFNYAVKLSSTYKIIVVAKGVPTIVAGEEKVFVCSTGNPGLGRGGSGDVLTGIISAFVAQGIPPLESAVAGVLVHGRCAERIAERSSMLGMLPTDVINELPYVFRELNSENRYY